MPYSSLRKVVHCAPEITYGSAPVFAAANTFVAEDFKVTPMEGESQDRNPHQAQLSTQRKKIGPRFCKVEFKVALTARATNVTPAPYRAVLLAAGLGETIQAGTSVTYSLVSSAFGSMAMLYNQDGEARTLRGIRGGVGFEFMKEGIPYLKFEGVGLYQARSASAMIAQDYTTWGEPDLVTQANTGFQFGGISLALEKLDVPVTNIFGYVNRPNQEAVVAQKARDYSASLSVLDEPRAFFDPETMMRNEATQVMTLQHGVSAGRRVQFYVNNAQINGVQESDISGEAGLDLSLGLTSSLGLNGDWLLVLS